MSKLVLFNKPYGVLTQFRDKDDQITLSEYIDIPEVYPAGRLDKDSEGLLLLTDDGQLQHQIAHPRHKAEKTYWVQVEGVPDTATLKQLAAGVVLKDGKTLPAKVRMIEEPDIWPRNPPVRFRAQIPTSWLELTIREGKNRQVRRMTAAVGYPTLRLVRYRIGEWNLEGIAPGEWKLVEIADTMAPQKNRIAKKNSHAGKPSPHRRRRH